MSFSEQAIHYLSLKMFIGVNSRYTLEGYGLLSEKCFDFLLGTIFLFCGYSPMLTPPILHLALSYYIYNLTTLCLNGTLPCVDFMDVIMGDIPIF